MRKTRSSKPQLFVASNDATFSPTKVVELDPKTGKELQAYYNRGGGAMLLHVDIDLDGNEELLYAGINDSYNHAFLSVLDPSDINGHAPVTEKHIPLGVGAAREKYYLMFPKSELCTKYSPVTYNIPKYLWSVQGKQLYYQIEENLQYFPTPNLLIQFVYQIESPFRVTSVAAGDGLMKAQQYLLSHNLIKQPLLPGLLNQLKDSLQYWDGEKFVYTPTMNKRYRAAHNLP